MNIIRTSKLPVIQSRDSWPLSLTTLLIILVAIVLPNSPLAAPLGFVLLPWAYWPVLAAIVLAYRAMVQIVKGRLTRRSESYLSTAA